MDLDGDGKKDLVSGSRVGTTHFFKNLGQGRFAPGVVLKRPDGSLATIYDPKDGSTTLNSTSSVVDWDGDGIPDLVVGSYLGTYWMKGLGDLTFGDQQPIEIDGQLLAVNDAGVHFADWNRDGVPDLLMGSDEGGVKLYLGSRGENGHLSLTADRWLVESLGASESKHQQFENNQFEVKNWQTMELARERSAMRVKATVTDWNGDGKLDLLVGDFMLFVPRPASEQDPAEKKQLNDELMSKQQAWMKRTNELDAEAAKELGISPQSREPGDWRRRYVRSSLNGLTDETLWTVTLELAEIQKRLRGFSEMPRAGYVWVYLGK